MEFDSLGRLILLLGVGLILLGGLFMLFGRAGGHFKFGSLPGDIRVEGSNFACFAPIGSMCLLSLLLTIILNVVARLLSR